MLKRIGKLLFIAILFFLFPLININSGAEDLSSGIVVGNVLNITLNGKRMEGLDISLYQYDQKEVKEVGQTKTDQGGSFSFQGLNVDENLIYYTATEYMEVVYFSKTFKFRDKIAPPVDLNVYETTDQGNNIRIRIHHILLEHMDDAIGVREFMVVENRGDRTYVGSREVEPGKRETLRISLLKEASNLQYVQSLEPFVVKTEDGFISTADIKPGPTNIVFSYKINSSDSNIIFRKGLHLGTDSLEFIYPEKGISVRSNQLALKGPTQNEGQRFLHLSGKDFLQGSEIVVELSLSRPKKNFKWVIAGLVILLFGIGFTFSFVKGRRDRENEEDIVTTAEDGDPSRKRQAVLEAIAELDDRHESGEISPEAHQLERASLLNEVKELTKIDPTLNKGQE